MTTLAIRAQPPNSGSTGGAHAVGRAKPIVLLGVLAAALGLGAALEPRAAVLIVAAITAPLLAWAEPRIALGLLCITLGINLDVISAPVHVSLPQLLALVLIAAVALRRPRPAIARVWAAAGFIVIVASLPSLARVQSIASAASALLQLLAPALLLGAAARIQWAGDSQPSAAPPVRTVSDVDAMFALLVIGGLVSLAPAVAQVALDLGPATYRLGGVMRAYSTYGQPNTYGQYLVGVLPLAAALAARSRSIGWTAAALAIGAGVVSTGSRGAWIAAAAGLLAFFIVTARARASTIAAAIAGLVLAGALVAFTPEAFIAGRFDLADWSAQQRLLLLLSAWDGITRSPILGHGPGSFADMLPAVARQGLTDDVVMPHNLLIHVWFEQGLLALIALIGLLAAYYIRASRAYRASGDLRIAALIAATTAMLASAMFGSLMIRGVQELFVLLVAMTAALVAAGGTSGSRAPAAPAAPEPPMAHASDRARSRAEKGTP